MDERFPGWLRIAYASLDDELAQRRWLGVSSVVEKLTPLEAPSVALIAAGCSPISVGDAASRALIQQGDDTFPSEGADVELAIVLGAALVEAFQKRGNRALDIAALCTLNSTVGGNFRVPLVKPVVADAERYLDRRAEHLRNRETPHRTPGLPPEAHAQLKKAMAAVADSFAEGDLPGAETPFREVATALEDSLVGFATSVQVAVRRAQRDSAIEWEALALDGWTRRRLMDPFPAPMGAAIGPLAGVELASISRIVPGPSRAAQYLEQVLGEASTVEHTALDVITASSDVPGLVDARFRDMPGPGWPFMKAILDSVSGSPTQGLKSCGLSPKRRITTSAVALQVFRELASLRLIERIP